MPVLIEVWQSSSMTHGIIFSYLSAPNLDVFSHFAIFPLSNDTSIVPSLICWPFARQYRAHH